MAGVRNLRVSVRDDRRNTAADCDPCTDRASGLGDGSGRRSLHEDTVDVGIIPSVATIGLSAHELALTRSVNESSAIAASHSGSWSKFPRVTALIKTWWDGRRVG